LDHFIKVKLFSFIHRVLKLVVELFLLKSAKFARYRKFGVFAFDGHFDQIAVFFLYLEVAYTYDLGITPVRSQAGGCLTTKNIV
jgi:hypothetical protein